MLRIGLINLKMNNKYLKKLKVTFLGCDLYIDASRYERYEDIGGIEAVERWANRELGEAMKYITNKAKSEIEQINKEIHDYATKHDD